MKINLLHGKDIRAIYLLGIAYINNLDGFFNHNKSITICFIFFQIEILFDKVKPRLK